MDRAFRLLLPALIAVEIALVWAGLLDISAAIGLVIGIELLLVLIAGRQIVVAIRRYRCERAAGLDVWSALEDGLAVLLPRRVARRLPRASAHDLPRYLALPSTAPR